jgi:hypothetical protein
MANSNLPRRIIKVRKPVEFWFLSNFYANMVNFLVVCFLQETQRLLSEPGEMRYIRKLSVWWFFFFCCFSPRV